MCTNEAARHFAVLIDRCRDEACPIWYVVALTRKTEDASGRDSTRS